MKNFEESYAELVQGRERYESQEYTFTYKDLARLITAVLSQMKEEMTGHLVEQKKPENADDPEHYYCWFDAGSEREVMDEQMAMLGLAEHLADPIAGMTWHLGFDIFHNQMEK